MDDFQRGRPERSMSLYSAIHAASWLAFVIAWAVLAIVFGGGIRRRYSPTAVASRLLLGAALLLWVWFADPVPLERMQTASVRFAAAGAVLSVVGVAFAIWARVALGRNWGMPMTIHEDPELVTSGPYRYVRHPIYTGVIALMVGTALIYPIALIPCAVVIVYTLISALCEERDMRQKFPEAYREYRERSKMLIPFLL